MKRGENIIRVWTIQSENWWEALQRDGTIAADERCVYPAFVSPYRWLIQQMQKRLPGYGGGWPIWFWAEPKPDLRSPGHLEVGECGLRLELQLPRDQVLLLDFET